MQADSIKQCVEREIHIATELAHGGNLDGAFHHLERAHVLGQANTFQHTRVHWLMLKIGIRKRDSSEIIGQVLRIGGASTKTPIGIYPKGNTGGANVSPFRKMPIAADLQEMLKVAGDGN